MTNITNITKFFEDQMVFVEGGSFMMGATKEQEKDFYAGNPAHKVTLSDFYISRYQVTQAEWHAVMGSDPTDLFNKGCDQCPVEGVSWDDTQVFLKRLNQLTGKRYCLPTEAQWEYAARGGNKSKGYTYAGSNDIDKVAWYDGNYRQSKHGAYGTTHPVGTKAPNELGLYDMSGNVCEWCSDWYGRDYYANSPDTNPNGPDTGSYRVLRGGSWYYDHADSNVAFRNFYAPARETCFYGFRLACSTTTSMAELHNTKNY